MSIKDFAVRVTKKGKTRGRPSNMEILASELASKILEDNKEAIRLAMEDLGVYGTGITKIENGKAEHIKYFDFIDKDKIFNPKEEG